MFPPAVDPHAQGGRADPDAVRLVPRVARRTSRRTRLTKDEDERRPRDRRALRVRASACSSSRRRSGRTCCCGSATRSTPTRSRPARSEFIRERRDTERAARRAGRRLRGVHAPLLRLVDRPDRPLAAVDGLERDDLRRPRRPRRLEHVEGLGRGVPPEAVVERAHRRRADVVLDLPAHRQPVAARARARTSSTSACCEADDAGPMLREFAYKADREVPGSALELLPPDRQDQAGRHGLARRPRARAGRAPDGRRRRVGLHPVARRSGDYNHLFLATSLPYLLAPGMQHLEAWNEAVCDGAWGKPVARARRVDPPGARPGALGRVRQVVPPRARAARGGRHRAERGEPAGVDRACSRATSTTPTWPRSPSARDVGMKSAVYQAVCSPFRNPLDASERRAIKAMATEPARWLTRALARAAGVRGPGDPLALRAGPDVRQPDRDDRVGGPRRASCGSRRPCRAMPDAPRARERVRAQDRLGSGLAVKTVARRQT